MQGQVLVGKVTGTAVTQIGDAEATSRDIDLAAYAGWQPTNYSKTWFLEGDALSSYDQSAEGLHINVDLPTMKTDASEGGGITRRLHQPIDISGMGAVRLRWSSDEAHDAKWFVRIHHRAHGWYKSPPLLHLRPGNTKSSFPCGYFRRMAALTWITGSMRTA
jgi:hypothetical protein